MLICAARGLNVCESIATTTGTMKECKVPSGIQLSQYTDSHIERCKKLTRGIVELQDGLNSGLKCRTEIAEVNGIRTEILELLQFLPWSQFTATRGEFHLRIAPI